ncbi:Uncharacterised protein [Ewingella americana]|uniref:Uncharacterized protein n=1 Tax=Ewingella americana TaxID=41202 RepID=A0A377N7Z9_9GAMM|nr:Uncharacterised protein [Ewingella americana]
MDIKALLLLPLRCMLLMPALLSTSHAATIGVTATLLPACSAAQPLAVQPLSHLELWQLCQFEQHY